MQIIGLTGGIASGKTTVSKYLSTKGIKVIDADQISRDVIKQTKLFEALVATFGQQIVDAKGELNRPQLGEIVFNDTQKLGMLNKIMAPFIRQTIFSQLNEYRRAGEKLVIVDAPTLFEAGYQTVMDSIIVVYVPENIQLVRLMRRNNLSQADAIKRIKAQINIEIKKDLANYVVDNQADITETLQQVDAVLTKIQNN